MDPNAARATMIEKANQVLASGDTQDGLIAATALAEAVHDLDEWLRSGGFYPDEWARVQHTKQDVDISVPEAKPVWEDTTSQENRLGGICGKTVGVMEDTGRAYRPCTLDQGHYGTCVPQDA